MPYIYWDSTYILVVIGAVICMIASARVKTTFNKYSAYRSMSGMTGAQAAERILHAAGIYDVRVQHVSGNLTDHYNPANKTLNLSDSVCNQTSVAAVGVAAHECGHAIQHARGYVPLRLRTAFVPIANFGSMLAWPVIILGVIINSRSSMMLINIGILLFSFAVLFQLITLPVEFDASRRAMVQLREQGILGDQELHYTRKVLTAAALTYVASAAAAIVLEMLLAVNEDGQSSHLVLRDVLAKYQYLGKQERAFLTRLMEGTLERQLTLDYVIDQFSKTRVKKMKPLIRNLMRMSVYQIMYMDSVPDSAVCNEAVKLARKRGFSGLSGFVNGVLRSVARGWREVRFPNLSVTYSMPEWIVDIWTENYGEEKTRQILEGLTAENRLTIRTNLSAVTPEELVNKLKSEGVTVHAVPELPYAFEISGLDYLAGLKSFKEGLFYVQDVSSMLVAETAAPKKNDYVIDVCAAPGGKSTHMAELLQGSGMVEARDLTEYKVDLIRENIARHGLSNMKAVQMDATVDDPDSHQKADVLVCDLPCSGLGVMGKKTDIRYKMTKEKAAELAKLQRQILSVVWDYVRPGGTLVYSTCTIHRSENEDNTAWFLKEHPEFSLEFQRQIFPGEAGSDGFFLAKLVRSK